MQPVGEQVSHGGVEERAPPDKGSSQVSSQQCRSVHVVVDQDAGDLGHRRVREVQHAAMPLTWPLLISLRQSRSTICRVTGAPCPCAIVQVQADFQRFNDRGCQYSLAAYAALAGQSQVALSVGRTGQCWSNALGKSFFSSLEASSSTPGLAPRAAARRAVVEYIAWYNGTRLHL